MRHTPHYIMKDPEEVKRLIRENPWATIVSNTAKGLVASHYPVVLEEDRDEISIVSHVGRPDDRALELGQHEVLVIIQGPHGYVSPSWYGDGPAVPTWNHVTAHLYGTPEILSDEENWRVLTELVHHFEDSVPHPKLLEDNEEYGRKIVSGTAGFRLVVTRFEARAKLSQDKPDVVVDSVIDNLAHGEHYSSTELAAEMRRVHGGAGADA
ncbi:FMN-binding negative transcriptional regulator [Salinibacterium sp. SYSU T00001]|uniref:FMN-binding negative transcriptional regulator n=1 Tax=Homoserinimonas sedimenticola TaxID=2986805 RepID=UPI0022359724|nr:FMN-binding negative transcriptional regulator [Salinibacterium sedimenticola]MCW4384696.1 FMN-binding negative transcriptional regulator [Salinibacterium sedimenticola]